MRDIANKIDLEMRLKAATSELRDTRVFAVIFFVLWVWSIVF